jgi:glyoxylase-like metal-dependent hydrolase (beta-lactamase superfamily II)
VQRALQAIGGMEALSGRAGLTVQYYTVTFGLGQEETSAGPARATITSGSYVIDWNSARRVLTTETRQVSGNVVRQRRVTAQGIGMLENEQGAQQPDPPGVVANVERTLRTTPEGILLAAVRAPSFLSPLPPKPWRGEVYDGARYTTATDTLSLYFDRTSGLLTVVERLSDDGILGDRSTVTTYTRWQETGGGLRLPHQVDVEVNGRLQTNTVVTSATTGPVADSLFRIPDSIAARAQRAPATTEPPPVPVNLVELAPGVWRAEGGTHFSLVVEQPSQLVMVEAPQNSARVQAVLDTLRARFPSKPVGLVVNTHHHWDHAGGVRAALAAGIPVLTHRRNLAFVRGIGAAKKTIAPDALSRRPRTPVVRTLDDSLTIGTGDSRVVVYRVPTMHSDGMLAAYVPAARLLFTSDVLSPGATLNPVGSREIAALARAYGIAVERVAGGHGGVATWPDLERAAGN